MFKHVTTNTILVHYGEIALKGKNRHIFIHRLRTNIEKKLERLDLAWPVTQKHGYLIIQTPDLTEPELAPGLQGLADLPGIAWYAPARQLPVTEIRPSPQTVNLENLAGHLVTLAQQVEPEGKSFRVTVNRGDKTFPIKSPTLERELGSAIYLNSGWRDVNLTQPDQTFSVNIQTNGIFVYANRQEGLGGLPVGVSGRVLSLLSGGIDSPVASFLMAKRGCPVDFIHFTATTRQQQAADQFKITGLAQRLSEITRHSRLYLVPYKHFELARLGTEDLFELILFRRFMARAAAALARQIGADALVMGDCIGQVASQTVENLTAVSQSIQLPIFRPILTYDKKEIMALAQKIGTYQLSLQPYKDCCALFSQNPQTKSLDQPLTKRENRLFADYDGLLQQTLADSTYLEYMNGELIAEKKGPL